jgi:NAD(P)-dependent dehydrogenase (short-subunit alcohol dehydrogenase family)
MSSLEGKAAIVTGGASGIGRATARAFAREGARVCVADLNGEGAEAVAKELAASGHDAFALRVDVTDEQQNARMVAETQRRFGRLDAAFLNAGIGIQSTIVNGDVEAWNRVIAVNLTGVYLGMRAAAPAIVASGGGAIVATASVAGLRGGRGMPSYCASKHGVIGLVKAGAAELARANVRVNAVCPGVIDTPILGEQHGNPAHTEGLLAHMHPLRRVGQPEEVAELVAFLAGDRARFITAQAYAIDGGLSQIVAEGDPFPDVPVEFTSFLTKNG